MPFDTQRARPLLQTCDLPKLFVEELGWEPCRQKLTLSIGGCDYSFVAQAEKRGFIVWLCEAPNGDQPDHATRLKLDRKLSETSFEHLIVFVTTDRSHQSWVWVRREPGKPLSARTHEYQRDQPGDSLLQKLQALYVSLEEEEAGELSTVAVAGRARAAFDIERVTKTFYRDFDTQRKAFLTFIDGIGVVADREWYASVMLNRLMFIYFIQRKGFLDGDREYLRNRLTRCQQEQGKDTFYTFYRYFLLRLFHEGFGKRRSERAPDLEKLLGNIPYLNGGLFDIHELEKPERYGNDIQIPDQAFELIFDYFDKYQWHLDERPLRQDNEINPDVLGYIFEKFINQKQMGAYYTKEDITEYISKNTVLPFLFDAARAKCRIAFEGCGVGVPNSGAGVPPAVPVPAAAETAAPLLPASPSGAGVSPTNSLPAAAGTAAPLLPASLSGAGVSPAVSGDTGVSPAGLSGTGVSPVWGLLADNPDRYIYAAVRHGTDLKLPPEIAIGIDTTAPDLLDRRKAWNKSAPGEYALPTETWREVVTRRQRYEDVRQKLASGAIHDINDLITLNLDIRQFAQDVIQTCEGPDLLTAFWQAISGITILDPTGGSGAFIFAALNILDPLYEACLDRMEGFLTEWERGADVSGAGVSPASAPAAGTAAPLLLPALSSGAGVPPAVLSGAGVSPAVPSGAGVPPAGPSGAGVSPAGPSGAGVSPAISLAAAAGTAAPRSASSKKPLHPNYHKRFSEILARVDAHPNRRYFVLKSIILNNLYAVDIMEEAVEICKLRLFLKLAAQVEPDPTRDNLGIEPLPDIDFNIRAGNTLVGYATVDEVRKAFTQFTTESAGVDGKTTSQGRLLLGEEADAFAAFNIRCADVEQAFTKFRQCQTDGDGSIPAEHKQKLQNRLKALEDELNRHLAGEYGVSLTNKAAYAKWLKSHQPFHWFIQFYGIIKSGGFDVIIGNPPYVEYKDIKNAYRVHEFKTLECGDLYALTMERAYGLLQKGGRVGMIVPVSIFCVDGFKSLQTHSLQNLGSIWASSYSNRPDQLFDGAQKRLTIVLATKDESKISTMYTTSYHRWRKEEFPNLFFAKVCYAPKHPNFTIFPASLEKLGSRVGVSAFLKLARKTERLESAVTSVGNHHVYYTRKFGYFLAFLDFVPKVTEIKTHKSIPPSELKELCFPSIDAVQTTVASLSSSTFFWFWNVLSDCRNLNRRDILSFPLNPVTLPKTTRKQLVELGKKYLDALRASSYEMKKSGLMLQTFKYSSTKPILNKIDTVLAAHYGFTDEELDFIINYDIKYRMGRDVESVEE